MILTLHQIFLEYWSRPIVLANIIIFFNLLGSLVLGLLVGYERSYRGRAAGMRTYGLVCMGSTALVVIVGYPEHWYGGFGHFQFTPDVTRVIQGIVTGIGFLGAGVIMREGLTISGLTTSASIWTASAIGIMVGVGFYIAAILFAALCTMVMMWGFRLENRLPSRLAIALSLTFKPGFEPSEEAIKLALLECDYGIASGTFSIGTVNNSQEWRFVAVALKHVPSHTLPLVSKALGAIEGIENHHVQFARN